MNIEEFKININTLIVFLMRIDNFNKDIHYHAHGDAFYSKHIFADKFEFNAEIDKLKEVALLGMGIRPLASVDYLMLAGSELERPSETSDKENFKILYSMIEETLKGINSINAESNKGVENLIGAIAEKLMQYKGLLNLQIE